LFLYGPTVASPSRTLQVLLCFNGDCPLAFLDLDHDSVEDLGRDLLARSERLEDVGQHEPESDDLTQLRAGGRLGFLPPQLIKDELADEFTWCGAALGAVFGKRGKLIAVELCTGSFTR